MFDLKGLLAVVSAGAMMAVCANDPVFEITDKNSGLEVLSGGVQIVKGDSFGLLAPDWKPVANLKSGKGVPSTSPTGESIWTWNSPDGSLVRTLSKSADGAKLSYDFSFPKELNGKYFEFCLYIDRAAFDFPKESLPIGAFEKPIEVQTLSGLLGLDPSGSVGGKWYLDDFRDVAWSKSFRIRFSGLYDPASGAKGCAVLSLKASPGVSKAFVQLPLNKETSRAFKDDASLSGWTAQGHENDLSGMPTGQLLCAGVPFDVTGRAILLKSSNSPSFPASSGLMKFAAPLECHTLNFLHTAAWSDKFDVPVAKYKIVYADGSSESLGLRYGRELIDWWLAQPTLSSRLAWAGLNGGGHMVGVYMMRALNPHPEKAVAGIEFVSENSACIPALLAITATNSKIATKEQLASLEKAFGANRAKPLDTKGWKECAIAWKGGIEDGSAIDFSFLNHKPAGKFGFLKRVGGEFEFEGKPGEPVRFWGTNFAIEGPFPDKSLSPGIAKTMAAQGVNLVRLHLYAARPALLQKDDGLNPEMLDKMLFLIAELEKNGVYIYMDLNDGMCYDQLLKRPSTFKPEEWLKLASLFDPELKKATKRLAELLFRVDNPYTGKPIAKDPGIAMFETMNEVSFLQDWRMFNDYFKNKDSYRAVLESIWAAWLKAKKLEAKPLPKHFNDDPEGRRFATEMDTAYLGEMSAYLRSIGVKAPVCGTNITFANGNLIASAQMDFLGDHDYWAHPSFAGGQPGSFPPSSALSRPVWTPPVGELGKCSLKGYPQVHSEWNYCFPNAYRCEGIPTAAAYAAYQGWDGMIFYGATGSCDDGKWNRFLKNPGIMVHSQQTDPATWGLSQIGAAMFRRGDVEQAKRVMDVVLPESSIYEDLSAFKKMPFLPALGRFEISFGKNANWLGELAESKKTNSELYAEVLRRLGLKDSNEDSIISDTKQIRRYVKPALLLVDTPKTQSATGRLCDLDKSGDSLSALKFKAQMSWGSINATAIDALPLKDSKRVLFVAVADAANTGERIESGYIIETGKAPVLIEPFKARISLESSLKNAKLYALNSATGARVAELPLSDEGGALSFQLDGSQGTIYFELVSE